MMKKFASGWNVVRKYSTAPGEKFDIYNMHPGADKMVEFWKKMTFFVAMPMIGLGLLNTYLLTKEEERTLKRPEFVPYEHFRIRNKRFPWGDGNHTLFHNPHRNALPDGYEAEEEHHD